MGKNSYIGNKEWRLSTHQNSKSGKILTLLLAGALTFGGLAVAKLSHDNQDLHKRQVIETVGLTPVTLPTPVLQYIEKAGFKIDSLRQAVLNYENTHTENDIRKLVNNAPLLINAYLAVLKNEVLQEANKQIDLSKVKIYRSDSSSGDMSVYAINSDTDERIYNSTDTKKIKALTDIIKLTKSWKKLNSEEQELGKPIDIDKADTFAQKMVDTYLGMISYQKRTNTINKNKSANSLEFNR